MWDTFSRRILKFMFDFLRKLVPDTHPLRLLYHKVAAFVAALVNFYPSDNMIVIGVTGTNGKTTVVNLIAGILTVWGQKVGMTSTVNFQIGDDKWTNVSKQSTLGAFKMQGLLKRMKNEGCKYAVVEVTSHAVTQSRIAGINFDVGVITNVTPDHVEYHGGFNNYLNEKGKFFKKVSMDSKKVGVPKVLVLNADDQYYNFFNQYISDRKITYGMNYATVYSENVESTTDGSKFILHVPNNVIPVEIRFPGQYNVYNALAAASACIAIGVPLEIIKKGLEESAGVPGRSEQIYAGQPYSIVVDYAHTPEALENLTKLYKGLTRGKLYTVFGATGGGRDKSKRPKMGQVVNENSDYIIVTDDDPYSEDELDIIEQVSTGIPRKEGRDFWKIPDRREAIRLALSLAKEGDCVIVAGKGCEEVIMLRGKRIPWNDKQVIEGLLSREAEISVT
ncbi:UDP-N-acetylmuramoyl-L-alanyl-D-glutamate--2,6-diaminopimelate ligase [Candidatus Peregrinibacteria bacterium CG_4_10_14_0_2_um_filter_38_24]|nr:MAG: UDP-N-acetylmuramoyl-L-alanyl-D-glutamate--2,6-diaminopimelate ligase [Candidatus Peregrinibacteria bacterium CG_4_10_14_0_2_um_filter_38_24]PJC38494.1 MAG: UDP-N-acetylmuramoyl-L-alanyl-D-glutamate--2,6-diaminopimelate ligase [Candidatus Peregrinibacteria bacterium CG_4_9_14_0_2_um_filter_38_9]